MKTNGAILSTWAMLATKLLSIGCLLVGVFLMITRDTSPAAGSVVYYFIGLIGFMAVIMITRQERRISELEDRLAESTDQST